MPCCAITVIARLNPECKPLASQEAASSSGDGVLFKASEIKFFKRSRVCRGSADGSSSKDQSAAFLRVELDAC